MAVSSGTYTVGTGQDYSGWSAAAADIAAGALTGPLIFEGNTDEVINVGNTGVTFSGFTTTATNKLVLRAASGFECLGQRGEGHRIKSVGGSGWGLFNFDDVMHWDIEDLGLIQEGSLAFLIRQVSTIASVNGVGLVNRCIAIGDEDGDTIGMTKVIEMLGTWADFDDIEFRSSIVVGSSNGIRGSGTIVKCNNVTLVYNMTDNDVSRSGFRNVVAKNCAAFHYGPSSGNADFLNLESGSANNASSDTSGNIDNVVAADEFVDVGATTYDLHITTGGALEAAGATISGVTLDIDGDTFDGSSPSIGADEPAASGTTIPIFMHNRQQQ